MERICFQVEEAQWFYEDFVRPLDPGLPSLSLKAFSLLIFQHCPLMSQWTHYHRNVAFSEFLAYKTRVPVRGAILLSEDMEEVVLVKGWKKGANWSFPRGKINKDERDLDCAVREVYEETGFDVREAGLVDEDNMKSIEVTMREQHMRLYVFRGVPRSTHFEPRTRKEISKIEWYKLTELPTLMRKNKQHDQGFAVANANKFYMVAPFMHSLKKWIAQQRKLDAKAQAADLKQAEKQIDEIFPTVDTDVASEHVPAEIAAPSPQVAFSEDPSSRLKRLLNIGGDGGSMPVQEHYNLPPVEVPRGPPSDQEKSNAILSLLRNGPSSRGSEAQRRPSLVEALQEPSVPPISRPYLSSTNGFSEHQRQVPPMLIPEELDGGPKAHELPISLRSQTRALPQQPRKSLAAAAAPYRQTGDPQFSQQAQHPQLQSAAAVPSASALPKPKLSNHSLALLNVFKDRTKKSPKSSAAVPNVARKPMATGKPSTHQDYLLDILKGSSSAAAPRPEPAELPTQPPNEPLASAPKQILRRPCNAVPLASNQQLMADSGAESSTSRIESPADKNFLLDFLQGVAKGNE